MEPEIQELFLRAAEAIQIIPDETLLADMDNFLQRMQSMLAEDADSFPATERVCCELERTQERLSAVLARDELENNAILKDGCYTVPHVLMQIEHARGETDAHC